MIKVGDVISKQTGKPSSNYEQQAMETYLNKGGMNNYPERLRKKVVQLQQERAKEDNNMSTTEKSRNKDLSPAMYLSMPI